MKSERFPASHVQQEKQTGAELGSEEPTCVSRQIMKQEASQPFQMMGRQILVQRSLSEKSEEVAVLWADPGLSVATRHLPNGVGRQEKPTRV
jgi:hypothetical protein